MPEYKREVLPSKNTRKPEKSQLGQEHENEAADGGVPADRTAEADTAPPPPWPGLHQQDDTLTFLTGLSAPALKSWSPSGSEPRG